jgi:tripartite-type tricarboxylate transporter receptor subunit TctC
MIRWLSILMTMLCAVTPVSAQSYPSKIIRVVVPFAPGSTADIVPRLIFEQLGPQLGQTIVVENRAGAGGTIGSAAVARSDADGYTLLATSNAHTIAPAFYPGLSYRPASDFAAVVPLGISPNVLVVSPSRGFRTIDDLVAAAKKKPGSLNFSSVGIGSATHFAAERFRQSAGLDIVHVPFKGGPEAMSEVIAGRIDFYFGPVGTVLQQVREGKLLALVQNGSRRAGTLPEVPTTREAGFADAEFPIWFGLFAPAKTPPAIVAKLHDEALKAMQSPKTAEKLAGLGVELLPMSSDEFARLVEREVAANAALVKAAGIQPPQ